MNKKEQINQILILFYEQAVQDLSLDLIFDEFGLRIEELIELPSFKKYFYVHNGIIKLRANLRVGKIQKRKTVDFLLTQSEDYRLVFKALAFDGDLVLMDLTNESILLYLKRGITHLIATVNLSKKGKPFFTLDFESDYHLEVKSEAPFIKGAIIYLQIDEIIKNKVICTYLKTIAHVDDPDAEMLKIVYKHEWPVEFSEELLHEADNLTVDYQLERQNRLELTNLLTFTIDGEDAKDLDDAISLVETNDGYQVGIHIADIGYLVKEGSLIDIEAEKRGTSLYLVDRVIPMLPHQISNGVGSLTAGEEKLTISVLFNITKDYKVVNYEINQSIIKSSKRLSYTEVNQLIELNHFNHGEKIKNALMKLYEFSKFLIEERKKKGTIDFESIELKFIMAENRIVRIEKRTSGEAEKLIEALMILANETVATHLNNLNYPSVYRIHETPDLDRLMDSVKIIQKLGFTVNTKDFSNPKTIARLTDLAAESRYHKIVSQLVLKAMKRAKYTSYKEIHYGLNSQCYTHFTAPIRRYPDLILHRIIHDLLFDKTLFNKKFQYYDNHLGAILKDASDKERLAIEIERDVEKLSAISFLNNNLDKTYKGQIVSILPSGMFIELTNGIEGFCALRNLSSYFYYYEDTLNYINDFGLEYKLGDYVLVEYIGHNIDRLEIDFKIIKKV